MRIVDISWYAPDWRPWVTAKDAADLEQQVYAAGFALEDGLLSLEFEDAAPEAVRSLEPWLILMGAAPDVVRYPDTLELGIGAMLDGANRAETHRYALAGLRLHVVRLPFVMAESEGLGAAGMARRILTIVTSRNALLRFWSPIMRIPGSSTALDPVRIGGDGEILSPEEYDSPYPSTGRRMSPRMPPFGAVLEEAAAAAEAHLRAAETLDDALTEWHLAFYEDGHADQDAQSRLREHGQIAFALSRSLRELGWALQGLRDRAEGTEDALEAGIGGFEVIGQSLRNEAQIVLTHADRSLARATPLAREVRAELRGATELVAGATATLERQASESFQRRVSLFAGIVAVAALITGVAGANLDFWPLPAHGGILARGSLLIVVGLIVVASLTTGLLLRRAHRA